MIQHQQTNTTMGQAFVAAGYEPPDERLIRIAIAALAAYPRSIDGVRDAIFTAVRNDTGLMWVLFERWRRQAVDNLIGEAQGAIRAQRPVVGGGHHERGDQQLDAPSDAKPRDGAGATQRPSGAGHKSHGDHPVQARPAPTNAERHAALIQAKSEAARVLSKLDTVFINGQPIGRVTPADANAWARSHKTRVRFIEMLTANLPPDRPIGDFIRPEEADAIWAKAESA